MVKNPQFRTRKKDGRVGEYVEKGWAQYGDFLQGMKNVRVLLTGNVFSVGSDFLNGCCSRELD